MTGTWMTSSVPPENDVKYTGGYLLTRLSSLVGLLTDPTKDVDDAFSLAVQSPVFDFYVAVLFQKIHYRIGCVFSFLEQKLFQLCLLLAVFRFPFPPLIARHY